jgi:hypothetical protein
MGVFGEVGKLCFSEAAEQKGSFWVIEILLGI